jgi:hypothetical protein
MYRLRNFSTILILVMITGVSCKNSEKDLSLSVKEYQTFGMPDQKKLSSINDYGKVISALNQLKIRDPFSLPKKNSRKSGSVFNSFVNKENLAFVNDESLSLSDRAYQVQYYSSFQNALIPIYTDNVRNEQYFNKELIEFFVHGLYVHKKMFELAGKINNSKAEADISMQPGLKAVIIGYVSVIRAAFREQVKSTVYSAKDLDRLSVELSNSITENLKLIEPADRQQISIEIQNTIDKSPSAIVKKNFSNVQKLLKE